MADKIIQCGYMSGDTYSAAALLAVDPGMRIILVKDTKATGQYADKSALIQKIYRESGVSDRVMLYDISHSEIGIVELWKSVSETYRDHKPLPDPRSKDALVMFHRKLCNDVAPAYRWPRSITAVTGLLASKWNVDDDATRIAVAKAWKVGKLPTEQKFALYEYMGQLFAKTGFDIRPNIVVLWSRQSGKRGGAHLELDSSYKAVRELAHEFADVSMRATVILAGDERDAKMAHYANGSPHVINATDMWEAPVWKKMFGEATFLAQFAFYKYLADDYNVVHIGMRSGMLEAMALLGMQTFYMEGVGSASGGRMLAFSGAGIPYTRIQIEDAPGLTGRISEMQRLHTMETFRLSVGRVANANIKRGGFYRNFGENGTGTDWAARNYAKAKLLGVPLEDNQYDRRNTDNQWRSMKDDMDRQRGLTKTGFKTVVDLVTLTFK
jgi:hypothetical protein